MKHYNYKAITETGSMIHLQLTSELSYQDQTEQEYLISDNYVIIQETHDDVTNDTSALVIMKKMNGIVQSFIKVKLKPRKPITVKVTYTNGDVEIMTRQEAQKRFDVMNVCYREYNKGQDIYDIYCVKEIERVSNKTIETTLGCATIDNETLSDTSSRALEILN